MKIISTFFIAFVLMVSLAGCQQTTTHKEASVANMKLELPSSWQKTEDYQELVENFYDEWGDHEQNFPVDVYQIPKKDAYLILGVWHLSKYYDETKQEWEGWESALEYQTLDNLCYLTGAVLLDEIIVAIIGEGDIDIIEDFEQQIEPQTFYHTIHECDAIEMELTFEVKDKTCITYILSIFSKDDLGIVVMGGEEGAYKKYEESWQEIMDSVKIE